MANYKLYPRKTFSRYIETGTVTNEHGETFACFAKAGTEIGTMVSGGEMKVERAYLHHIHWGQPELQGRRAGPPCTNTGHLVDPPTDHGVHFDPEGEEFWIL